MPMQASHTTIDGDAVDAICEKFYGSHPDAFRAVLNANRGLAQRGAVLPAGITIVLPDLPKPVTNQTYELFD